MECIDEYGRMINYNCIETTEQQQVKEFIKSTDRVLELGARWGGVAITTNKILDNKKEHFVVEPDYRVWEALEFNKKHNNCEFTIIKGVISKTDLELDFSDKRYEGMATFTTEATGLNKCSRIDLNDIECDFNVLLADCEGFLEDFYNENKDFFKQLRCIILEKDRPEYCDYDRLAKEFINLGFVEKVSGTHCVYLKE